jgi:regulatory protein
MAAGSPDALEAALSALRRKERTATELAIWLEQRGHDPDRVQATIAELGEAGELDDERFARRYAEDKRELRGWGSERIRRALAERGVAPGLIDLAVGQDTDAAELSRASELLRRRGKPLGDDADRARALGFLIRRGYDYEVAHEAIRLASRRAT